MYNICSVLFDYFIICVKVNLYVRWTYIMIVNGKLMSYCLFSGWSSNSGQFDTLQLSNNISWKGSYIKLEKGLYIKHFFTCTLKHPLSPYKVISVSIFMSVTVVYSNHYAYSLRCPYLEAYRISVFVLSAAKITLQYVPYFVSMCFLFKNNLIDKFLKT